MTEAHADRPLDRPATWVPEAPFRYVYYRDDRVYLTGQCLYVDEHRFELAELGEMYTTRSGAPLTVAVSGLATVGLVAGVVLTVLAGQEAFTLPMSGGLVLAVVTATAGWRTRPYELWTHDGGREVLLFRTRDATRFHKLCRSLRRALTRP